MIRLYVWRGRQSLERRLFEIHQELLDAVHNVGNTLMALIDDLQAKADATLAKVTSNTDLLTAIKTIVDADKQQILDLKAALDAAGTDPAKLKTLSDTIDKLATGIDAQATAEAAIAGTGFNPSGN